MLPSLNFNWKRIMFKLVLLSLLTFNSFAGDLGVTYKCHHEIKNMKVKLVDSTIRSNKIPYDLVFSVSGTSKRIKTNVLNIVKDGHLDKKEVHFKNKKTSTSYLHNNIRDLEMSGGVIGRRGPTNYKIILRGTEIRLINTRYTGYPSQLTSTPGDGELIIGKYNPETKAVKFDLELVKIAYTSRGKSKSPITPVFYKDDGVTLSIGYYDEDEAPFFPYDCK
jgi:hypothetical protein